jgi:hypothetical protein
MAAMISRRVRLSGDLTGRPPHGSSDEDVTMWAGSEITVVNYDYDLTNALVRIPDGALLVVFRDDLEKREEPLE